MGRILQFDCYMHTHDGNDSKHANPFEIVYEDRASKTHKICPDRFTYIFALSPIDLQNQLILQTTIIGSGYCTGANRKLLEMRRSFHAKYCIIE